MARGFFHFGKEHTVTDLQKDPLGTSAAFAVYELAFAAGALAFAPYALVKMLYTPAYRAGLSQRLSLKIVGRAENGAASPVWIQTVSVGEVKSAAPLVRALLQGADCAVRLSTTTFTGQRVARELFPDAVEVGYFPLDFRWVARRVLSRIQPQVVVLFETELWPNFIRTADASKIPVVIVNGRISEASFRYYRMLPWIFRATLSRVSHMGMQSAADAERIIALGANPDAVTVCGNMKFDAVGEAPSRERIEDIRRELLLPHGAPLIVGGSTHEGEEKALLKSLSRIQARRPEVRLLIAPRHPERFEEVERLIRDEGFDVLRRSKPSSPAASPGPKTVILLDTIGELAQVYALASIAFVGGSLADVGGHNIIEPASMGKPVVFGPHMQNFKDVKDAFLLRQAALCIGSEEELHEEVEALLGHHDRARQLGDAARKVVESNRGATLRYLQIVISFLHRAAEEERA